MKGIGNLTSPFTLGVGSWAGDNYARFKPEEVQYGTREEVLKRKQTESTLVSLPIDMAVGSAVSKVPIKKIIPVKSTTVKKTTHSSYKSSTFMTPENYYNVKSQNGISYNTQQSIIKNYGNIIDDDYIVRNSSYVHQKNDIEPKFNFEHIINGEINRNNVSGAHKIGERVKVKRIFLEPDEYGVYQGIVEVYKPSTDTWLTKNAKTTIFPDAWSIEKTKWEINGAWNSIDFKTETTKNGISWKGTSPSGVKIEGFLNKKGTRAFPKYEGGN